MTQLDLPPLELPEFRARASRDGTGLRVKLDRTADLAARVPLDAFLTRLHAEATRLGIDRVDVDLLDLEFMNSSCFKSFITWVMAIEELAPERQYRVVLHSNPDLHWQERSLDALTRMSDQLVTVVPRAAQPE
jgi:hypothetical protein